jgi:pyruvate dehydrogenase (quinone)
VIVFKNDALAFVELEMKAAGFLDFATDLQNPDFAKIADAAGLLGLTAERPEQVRPMITEALQWLEHSRHLPHAEAAWTFVGRRW